MKYILNYKIPRHYFVSHSVIAEISVTGRIKLTGGWYVGETIK